VLVGRNDHLLGFLDGFVRMAAEVAYFLSYVVYTREIQLRADVKELLT